jgi:hypothetical protein
MKAFALVAALCLTSCTPNHAEPRVTCSDYTKPIDCPKAEGT